MLGFSLNSKKHESVFSLMRVAVLLIFSYLVLCGSFILLSTPFSDHVLQSFSKIDHSEFIKGLTFVLLTTFVFLALTGYLLRYISKNEKEIIVQRNTLIASERHAMAGIFASSVAHDINNILTVVDADLDELSEAEELTAEDRALIRDLSKGVGDLAQLAKRLTTAGRVGIPGEFTKTGLVAVVKEAVDFARNHTKVRHCSVKLISLESLIMEINPAIIQQMILNLIINAAEATGDKGQIEVRVSCNHNKVCIEIHDNGPGIPKEKRHTIFTAFYTTKLYGAGLGLLSAKACAEAHKGSIEITESHLGGACFRVSLPIVKENHREERSQKQSKMNV